MYRVGDVGILRSEGLNAATVVPSTVSSTYVDWEC